MLGLEKKVCFEPRTCPQTSAVRFCGLPGVEKVRAKRGEATSRSRLQAWANGQRPEPKTNSLDSVVLDTRPSENFK